MKKIIPSIFTSMNLLCGFFAIVLDDIFAGSVLILCALLCDVLDGALARKLDVASDMGKELDSFADLVSFGMAPAYLYTLIAPMDGWVKFIPASIFIVGVAVRLARFNLLPSSKYFTGLPSPPAAFFLVGIFFGVYFEDSIITQLISMPAVYIGIPVILTFLMNGRFNMFSLKSINSGMRKDKIYPLVVLIFFLIVLFINSSLAIPLTIVFYLSMSFLYNFVSRKG